MGRIPFSADYVQLVFRLLREGELGADMLADDFLGLKEYPSDWEGVLIEASTIVAVDSFKTEYEAHWYFYLCALILVGMNSNWAGLPGLLQQLMSEKISDLHVYYLVREYGRKRKWNLPGQLKTQVARNYRAVHPAWLFIYSIDGHVRDVIAIARDQISLMEPSERMVVQNGGESLAPARHPGDKAA